MQYPVLATKLFAPARRAQFVARHRLVEMLDAGLVGRSRLTLVSAPAGFGKSSLLSDWLVHLDSTSQEIRVGWLSLDEDDNDLARLLAHLTAALRFAGVNASPPTLWPAPDPPATTAMSGILNDVVRAGDSSPGVQWILVLDDYHVIEAAAAHEAMTFLLDHLPGALHVVIATRSDPPLPLPRLRSRGQLTEVRAADLRFTPAEAFAFLHDTTGLDLTVADAQALEERTEGWIAGLQLAAISLRDMSERAEVATFIDAFTGSNRFIIDYLADEVLTRQPVALRDFLLRTAVLDRLTGDLCDAVTGGIEGRRMLTELERRNLFVVALDETRSWYRYHQLFADVLGARLLAEHPGEVPGLHRRASAWYDAHQLPVRAVRHALAAEDFGGAARLMEEALPGMRRARQDSLLLMWMQSLPEPVVRRSPVLTIVSAWAMMVAGNLDAMEHRLDEAEALLAAAEQDPDVAHGWAVTEDLRAAPATVSVYRAALAQARGDVPGMVRHARQALSQAGPDDHFIRGAGGGLLALASWAEGNLTEALNTFGSAVRSLHAAGNLVDELDATVVLADMWVASGRPGRARQLYERGLRQATAASEPCPRAVADLHVGLAELDRKRGDLGGAEAHLEQARELGQRGSITENRHRWYVAMAELRATTGDYEEAGDLLEQAEGLYRHGFYPDLCPIPATRARLAIAAGHLSSAWEWARDHGVNAADAPRYLREYEHLTLVRLLLAEGRSGRRALPPGVDDPVAAALGLLGRLHTAAAGAGREGSLVEIRMLQALAHQANSDRAAALVALERALRNAPEPDSHLRLYLDEGAPMQELLQQAAAQWGDYAPHLVPRLLDRPMPVAAGVERRQLLVDRLSRRELEVLQLLDSELTGPEISRQLFVSLNTLRTHTKRIFTKLDVNNRGAAVRRAHQLGLL